MATRRPRKPDAETPPATEPEADDFVPADGFNEGDAGEAPDEPDGADTAVPAKVVRTAPRAEKPAADEKPPPPFGTARPAGKGALPRVVAELDRAGAGQTRYKIACRNYTPQRTRYVLAAEGDEDGAVACYLAANGLDKLMAKLKKQAGKKADDVVAPELSVTELPD